MSATQGQVMMKGEMEQAPHLKLQHGKVARTEDGALWKLSQTGWFWVCQKAAPQK